MDLGRHWLRQWLVAWRHQAITWTNVDWSSVKYSDIHIRAISQQMIQLSFTKICLKIACKKFHSIFPGANESKYLMCFVQFLDMFMCRIATIHTELRSSLDCNDLTQYQTYHIWGLYCQKQVSQAGISNYIPQFTLGCNYLSLPDIPASGNKVLIYRQMG